MVTKKEILALVENYIKTNDLAAFSHSFAELFYDIETTGDAAAVQLAYSIEGELAAVTAGVCSESVLPDLMRSLLPSISVVIPQLGSLSVGGQQEIAPLILWGQMGDAGTVTLVPFGIGSSAGFGLRADPPEISQSNTALFPSQRVLAAI
jgi:hypothetical protein